MISNLIRLHFQQMRKYGGRAMKALLQDILIKPTCALILTSIFNDLIIHFIAAALKSLWCGLRLNLAKKLQKRLKKNNKYTYN